MLVNNFDVAFNILTGHTNNIDWSKYPKYIIKQDIDIVLWGPESRLMSKILIKAHNKYVLPHIKNIQSAFSLSEDITVNKKKLNSALKKSINSGKAMADDKNVLAKTKAVLKATSARSIDYYTKQSKKKRIKKANEEEETFEEAFEEFMASALSDHIETYTQEYPERVLHPEIKRLVQIVEQDPEARIIDKHVLAERIRLIDEKGEDYFRNLSDVQVGRAWNYTGLELAYQNDVTTYMIEAQIDDPNKPCIECTTLHGHTFSVEQARERMQQVLAETDPEKIKELAPFPRISELVKPDMTPEKISKQGYMPSFHSGCRCDVIFLGTTTYTETVATYEQVEADEFISFRDKIEAELKPFVTAYSKKEYKDKGAILFLSPTKKSGYAVTKEKDLVSVFSLTGAHEGAALINSAIENGAETLDCFDGFLPNFYNKFGFEEYDKVTWDDKYTPPGWNKKKYGTPDIIFMRHKKSKKKEDVMKQENKVTKELLKVQKKYIESLVGPKKVKEYIK